MTKKLALLVLVLAGCGVSGTATVEVLAPDTFRITCPTHGHMWHAFRDGNECYDAANARCPKGYKVTDNDLRGGGLNLLEVVCRP